MKLISMINFVKQVEDKSYTKTEKYNIIERQSKCDTFDKIIKYANFLKQPLTLGMFVPCDDDGNVVSGFYNGNIDSKDKSFTKLANEYNEAKKRVLFTGFQVRNQSTYSVVSNKDEDVWVTWNKSKTIEDLIPYNLDLAVSF